MLWFARLITLIIIGIGVTYIVNPKLMKDFMNFARQGNRVYIGGIVRFVIGIIFLLSVTSSRWPVVVAIFGILAIVAGVFIFAMGPDRMRKILDLWQGKPIQTLRLMAIIPIVIGLILMFSL